MKDTERRDLARRHLDSSEAWLRRFIRHQLTLAYGPDFFRGALPDGTLIVKSAIREQVDRRRAAEPTRFNSDVDALTFGEAISIVLHPRLFAEHFRTGVLLAFPDGVEEARTFLTRLERHRNLLAHGGACSTRVLEQCICYSNDLIESLKDIFWRPTWDRYSTFRLLRA